MLTFFCKKLVPGGPLFFNTTEPLHVQDLAQIFTNRLHLEAQQSVVFTVAV